MLTSLRGTLVPAKTLNKMISKIPVIGEKSVKDFSELVLRLEGPPGKIKTTINPIRTITPKIYTKNN